MSQISNHLQSLFSRQEVRFLAAGALNTALGFGVFATVNWLWGSFLGYLTSVYVAHFLVSGVAFFLYRKKVFRVHGSVLVDFARFQSVYLFPLIANTLLLPMLVGGLGWNVYLSQALLSIIIPVVSYFGHKHFSFRRKRLKRLDQSGSL